MVQETPAAPVSPGPIARLFQAILPGVPIEPGPSPLDEVISVRRDDFLRVMEAAHGDSHLQFDFLRCVSGVDWLSELEVVYHLHSYRLGHNVAIKVRFTVEDPHVPTVSHLWQAANWHERETHELFGIVFDGHPDLRPLLLEEGLGYYPLRKSHPLAEIEEWQEDYLQTIEEAKAQQAAAAGGAAPPVDEKAQKIAMAQAKAAIIKKTRDEARAKGLSPEDEKAAVQAALAKYEEDQAAAAPAPVAAPAVPADPRAAKIALAQQKAALIKKTREEARAKGLSPEEERQAVAEALKSLAEKGG